MKTPLPKSETVLAYLFFKRWEREEETEDYCTVRSPEKKSKTLRLKIPLLEKEPGYLAAMNEVVEKLAKFYKIKPDLLFNLFSKTTQQIVDNLLEAVMEEEYKKILTPAPA